VSVDVWRLFVFGIGFRLFIVVSANEYECSEIGCGEMVIGEKERKWEEGKTNIFART
jgi:hypothetical protein